MTAITDYAAFAAELEHEFRHLCAMVELLEVEQHVLVEGDAGRLGALAAEKVSQVRALEIYAARIGAFLRARGYGEDAGGFAECIAAAPQSKSLGELRAKIAEKSREARQLNTLNGALIEARLTSIEERAAAFTGDPATAETNQCANGVALAAAAGRALGAV